jgi:hypothetical protein
LRSFPLQTGDPEARRGSPDSSEWHLKHAALGASRPLPSDGRVEAEVTVRKPLSEKLVEHAITVVSWSYFYSYIADPLTRIKVDEFIHLETLELHGHLTSPRDKVGLPAKIMIVARRLQMDGQSSRYDRPVLGNIETTRKLLEA